MDFINGLLNSKGYEIIWVVIDRYSSTHFLPLSHPISAKILSQLFFDNIFKLQGLYQIPSLVIGTPYSQVTSDKQCSNWQGPGST